MTVNFTLSGGWADGNVSVTSSLNGETGSAGSTNVTVSGGSGGGSGSLTISFTSGSGSSPVTLTATQGGTTDGDTDNITVIAPSLETGSVVDEEAFYCPGDTIEVEYTAQCLRTGQGFSSGGNGMIQLRISDKNGVFSDLSAATVMTTISGGSISTSGSAPVSGTIEAVIPTATPSGTGYEFRVETTSGFLTPGEATNDDVEIRGLIISDPDPFPDVSETYCQGELLELMYNSNEMGGFFNANNEFRIVLSAPDGDFSNPANNTIIGRVATTDVDGPVSGIIPFDQAGGDQYKIRIESTNPQLIGCEYGPFAIPEIRNISGPLSATTCDGMYNFSATPSSNDYFGGTLTRQWESLCYDTIINRLEFPSNFISSIDGDPTGTNIFAGSGDGLLRSLDGGNTFTRITAGLVDPFVSRVFFDPVGNDVYAISGNGFSVATSPGGALVARTVFGQPVNDIYAINGDVYAITSMGIYESNDFGASFNPVPLLGQGGRAIHVIDDAGDRTIIAATFSGVAIRRGSAGTFQTYGLVDGLPSTDIRDIDVTDDGVIYLATGLGLAYSTDGGYNYRQLVSGLPNPQLIYSLKIAGNTIFVGTENGMGMTSVGVVEDTPEPAFAFYSDRNGLGTNFVNGVFAVDNGGSYDVFAGTTNGLSSMNLSVTPLGTGTTEQVMINHASSKCRYRAILTVTRNGKPCPAASAFGGIPSIPSDNISFETTDPTQCTGYDGEILVRGLIPNLQYELSLDADPVTPGPVPSSFVDGDTITTDENGQFTIQLLGAGEYTISLLEVNGLYTNSQCSSNEIVVTLNDPAPPADPIAPVAAGTPFCVGSTNFTLTLQNTSPPPADVQYQWFLDANATMPASPSSTADVTFEPNVTPTSDGSYYVRAFSTTTLCYSDTIEVQYDVQEAPSISVSKTQPTTAGGSGSITVTINNYDPTVDYTLSYNYNGGTTTNVPHTAGSGATISIDPAAQGDYENITVSAAGCVSNSIPNCPINFVDVPDDIIAGQVPSTVSGVNGGQSGYFQNATQTAGGSTCASDLHLTDADGIAVGRLRNPQIPQNNQNVEMRGYVRFDLASMGIPAEAVIERVEYRPVSIEGSSRVVCGPVVTTSDIARGVPLVSATGDLQFDVTRVEDPNFGPYTQGYNDVVFQDLFDEKYNDFTISSDKTGAWTDLGGTGVMDVQRRLNALNGLEEGSSAPDGLFQLGLSLSGSDFDIPVLQFHGVVFAPSSQHELRITYHLRDYGDLPEGKYLTDVVGGVEGPSHRIDPIDVDPDPDNEDIQVPLFIGANAADLPDAELDGQYSTNADGDDMDGNDDEILSSDDFTNPLTGDTLIAGNTITLTVPYINNLPDVTGTILAFVDWNEDGVFNNTDERFEVGAPFGQTSADIIMAIPATTPSGPKAVRVRISTEDVLDAYGHARNGEVEDFFIDELFAFDYGDLPDTSLATATQDYQTIYALDGSRGPRHEILSDLAIGITTDSEADGQQQINAFGDDVNGIDDEDGVTPPDSIIRGQQAVFEVVVKNTTGADAYLYGFADWNDDGSFEDAFPNQKAAVVTIPSGASGVYEVIFNVPQTPNPLPDRVATRFRLSDAQLEGISATTSLGPAADTTIYGEVEDMFVNIVGYDWGDLPEPLYITDAEGGQPGPSHKITSVITPTDTFPALYIGANVPDAEIQGQPQAKALGDDNNLEDDENLDADNFVNPTTNTPMPIVSGDPIRLQVPYTNNLDVPANLMAFIDWNADGDFLDDDELRVVAVPFQSSGTASIDYIVPAIPTSDSIGVRIRITSEDGLDAYGQAPDGEVEDFLVERRGSDYGDLPDVTAGTGPNDFNTLLQNNGPRHGVPVTPLTYLGAMVDTESDGQPTEESNGDDLDTPQSDDEDGVIFLTPLVPGQDASISISAVNDSAAMARVIIWTDWENDGVLDSVTQVDVPGNGSLTSEVVTFEVPSTATFQDGNSFWRLRITTDAAFLADPSPDGLATDGEVEDYFVPVFKVGNLVWEDRNNNGLQDADEINLGIDSVRVIMRFGGIDPVTGEYDGIAQDTDEDPYVMGPEGGADMIEDFIIDTLTDTRGLYLFTGMIEGNYQLITIDPSGLTPTRADWIRNVTEEDTDNDGNALEQPWEYADMDIRQSKTEVFTMYRDSIGTDEEGILDQGNPQLQDPNALEGFPDNRVEQRIDFGYTPFDFGDLPDTYTTVEDGVDIGTTQDGLFAQDTVLVGNVLEGPKHIVTPDIYLGSCSDAEVEGAPDFDAGQEFAPAADGEGDDPNNSLWDSDNRANTCEDDDNGVQFMTPLIPGYEAIIDVDFWATINDDGPDAYLQAFLDWNGDGDFYVDGDPAMGFDEDEHIVFTLLNGAPAPLDPNTHAVELEMSQQLDQDPIRLTFQVPDSAKYFDGNVLARFRISKRPNMAATGILPGNSNFPDGIVPAGEVEDYFMKLVKIGNIVWEDRDYDGIQDEDEPGIAGVEITLDYFGENDTLDGDFYENTYVTETDSMGLYYFYGLIGNVDPSGVMDPFYTLTASDPEAMTPTIDIDSIAPGDESNCITLNSDGNDIDIDDRITAVTFRITNPMGQCTGEMDPDGKLDMGEMVIMAPDNIWPDEQMDETFDFGYVGFDYGDLPDTSIAAEFLYRTKRDWLPQAPIDFGPRHAIQPKLYLGGGVDAELDGQPDDDAGSKEGGDDDVNTAFAKGDTTDDESGIRLLSPLLPGERAFIQVTYTSQDTVLAGGYADMDAFLNAFIDFNGDGDLEDATDAITFTHQGTSLTTLVDITDTTNPTLPGGDSLVQVLAFTVPDTSITDFNDGVAFMRYRLSWEGDLGPNNNDFHQTTPPFVDTSVEYPRGEVEDYAIPVARIGNLAWYDHNVNGHQDDPLAQLYNMYQDEYGVDTLHLVLIWGGVDAATGEFDTVGYNDETMSSAGAVEDILYNLSIAMPTGGAYDPAEILKTNAQGLYTFYGLIPGTYNLIPLKYLQTDSASFVDFWPKHRVLTLTDNPDAPDDRDSDACPGIVFTIDDANDKDPEVCVDNLVEGEDGELDDVDPTNPTFADNQWDQTLDLGWVDEPNIEANLDIVGVNFPTSEICGNFNVIMHLCVKNPTEVPLDSLMMTLNLREAYGGAFYAATKPMISIVDSSFVTTPADVKIKKTMAGSKEALTPFINANYDGEFNLDLLTGGDKDTDFFLPGDSVICVRVEFEIDPTQTDAYTANGWASQFKAFGRAVGFLYEDAGAGRTKRPLIDKFPKSPRFGQYIEVMDLSDELDDPMPMAGMNYPEAGDSILFEGMVADRGDFGEYQVFMNNLTGRDKYLDEDDKTLQNDECWIDTRFIGGQDDINVSMDANCEVNIMPNMVIADHIAACGFDKYPEGSYYRVIIQDKKTEETLWASVDREPFDVRPYLDRELIYKARSVANHCQVVWGNITFEDKTAPVVTCPDDTGESLTTGLTLVCSDIDSVLNNAATFEDPTHPYYTGIATAVDGCGPTYLDRVQDVLRVFADCEDSAQAGYAYARITRTFTFRDAFNNTDTCKQQIYFYRPEIVLPECQVFIPNVVAGTDTILTSEDMIGKYELPESVPYFINGGGERVYLLGDEVCGFSVNYENRSNFITGDCGRKIIRRWRIFDWCYATGDNYPDYLVERGECYDDATREGSIYTFEQTIVIGDTAAPVVTIPDLDLDGFKGSGYKGGPAANADSSTATYDADDRYVFTTRPQDCFADFRVTRDMWEVEEQSEWCFDVGVYIRRPILDLDERPTGEWMIMPDTDAEITGNCDDGYLITNVEMIKDTFVDYFLRMRFVDVCDKDTIIWAPINIVDDIMPVVVCDDELEVTFDNVGTGNVAAIDVDEGTNDNCGFIRWLKVRRPLNECGAEFATIPHYVDANGNGAVDAGDWVDENRNEIADELEFFTIVGGELYSPLLDKVPFFCCDRDSVKVELWAEDWAGNRNSCWTWADLTDRPPIDYTLPGNYTLPDNVTYNCEAEEGKVLILAENEGTHAEGSLVYQTVVAMFGRDVVFSDRNNTCPGFTTEVIVEADIDDCGFGTIEVTWLISNGDEVRNAGTRIITIAALHDYWLRLPADQTASCGDDVGIRGVAFSEDACDLIAISTEDERFTATQDPTACYKIFRTYRIINWCEYDGEAQPTIVSRDWDGWNGTNPVSPDGDDEPGDEDIYVIVKRDFADDLPDTVYYDNDADPSADNNSADNPATPNVVEDYWWRVISGDSDPSVEAYYEGGGSVWANDGDQTDSDITGNAQSDDIDQRYGSFGYWQYTQHIVVYDDVDPTLTITGADTFAATSNEDCAGDVTLQIEATDICTDDALDVTVQVILDGEDISDQLVDGVFTGRYEEGEYTLLVIADDGCGNVTTERYTFVVEDRKGPAPIVIDAISIELMPSEDEASGGGMAEVWASDFIASDIFDCNGQDATVTDANGNPRVTKYSINVVGEPVDMDQAGLSFTCADAARTIEVEIHGWDTKGNHDFAVTNLLVQDNMGVCDAPAGEGQIAGTIATEAGDAVNEVEVQLSGDRSSVYMTNATGTYAFTGLREDFDFSVIPGKDLFHGNGVSTFDLILIQRHILGSQAIASPYAQIAADVNKSGNISTLDMIQLRRLILNAGSRFENNTSWRFVAEDYVFPNPNNAFATSFPEVKNFNNLQGEEEANFVAVKVGDVNGSAMAYVQPRSDRGVTIDVVAPEVLKAGQTYSIALSSDELAAISGMQFTLQWAEGLELVDIASGVIGAEHMGVFTDERALTTSWNQPSEVIADGELLTLSLKATTDVALSEALRLNSRLTRVESYDVATDEVMSVFLSSSEAYTSDEAELYQNVPNPFVTETRIGFYLPSAGTAELTIRDVAGRVLRTIDGDYEAGYNEVRLDRQSLPAGTLYYTLSYDGYQLTKFMMHNR